MYTEKPPEQGRRNERAARAVAASEKLRDIVQSYAKEMVDNKESLNDLLDQNTDLLSANQIVRAREDDVASALDSAVERAIWAMAGEENIQLEVNLLKTALQEIATLQREFVSTAEEKRKHQLAMEMEIVGVVETFTDAALLHEKEKDAVDMEISLLKEALKKRMGIDMGPTATKSVASLKPLPENLPDDLGNVFPSLISQSGN